MGVTGGTTTDTLNVTGLSTLAATTVVGTANINSGAAATTNIGFAGGTNTILGTTTIDNGASNTSVTSIASGNLNSAAVNIADGTNSSGTVNIANTATSGGAVDIANTSGATTATNIGNSGVSAGTITLASGRVNDAISNTQSLLTVTNGSNVTTTTDTSTAATTSVASATSHSNLAQSSTGASLLVTNTANSADAHGISIVSGGDGLAADNFTSISGGTHSTTLTLDDTGATFAGTGGVIPAQVHGIADGTAAHDAVNVEQLGAVQSQIAGVQKDVDKVKGGVASVSAMANIPQVDQNKTFSLGMGYGNYSSKSAVALGGSIRVDDSAVVKASIGSDSHDATFGIGAAYSW